MIVRSCAKRGMPPKESITCWGTPPPPAAPAVGTITGASTSLTASTVRAVDDWINQMTTPNKSTDRATVPTLKSPSPNPNWTKKSKNLWKIPRELSLLIQESRLHKIS
jgi:hypothetical protein